MGLTPTATADLSAAVADLLRRETTKHAPYGLYQVTSQGECSWFEFARTIYELSGMKVDLSPITTAESGSRARRPAYSVLGHRRWVDAGMTELRPWREALGDYLRTKGHLATH
jgi:dTDP-4-dehydrorhamnose reductase